MTGACLDRLWLVDVPARTLSSSDDSGEVSDNIVVSAAFVVVCRRLADCLFCTAGGFAGRGCDKGGEGGS